MRNKLVTLMMVGTGTLILMGCIESPCKDVVQLPIPAINIDVVNAITGKSMFSNPVDTTNYNPDSLVVFVGNGYVLNVTKPFKVEGDSIIRIQNWTAMEYLEPKSSFLVLQYRRNKADVFNINYTSNKKSCDGTLYANFTINRISYNNQNLATVNSNYIIKK